VSDELSSALLTDVGHMVNRSARTQSVVPDEVAHIEPGMNRVERADRGGPHEEVSSTVMVEVSGMVWLFLHESPHVSSTRPNITSSNRSLSLS